MGSNYTESNDHMNCSRWICYDDETLCPKSDPISSSGLGNLMGDLMTINLLNEATEKIDHEIEFIQNILVSGTDPETNIAITPEQRIQLEDSIKALQKTKNEFDNYISTNKKTFRRRSIIYWIVPFLIILLLVSQL